MKFITPCFVRVEDAERRNKLIEWAEGIGYEIISRSGTAVSAFVEHGALGAYAHDGNTEAVSMIQAGRYDCGTDIELFKALAAMNDENDREQWFTDTADDFCLCSSDRWSDEWQKENFEKYYCYWRKATAEEIIEHFKNSQQ